MRAVSAKLISFFKWPYTWYLHIDILFTVCAVVQFHPERMTGATPLYLLSPLVNERCWTHHEGRIGCLQTLLHWIKYIHRKSLIKCT